MHEPRAAQHDRAATLLVSSPAETSSCLKAELPPLPSSRVVCSFGKDRARGYKEGEVEDDTPLDREARQPGVNDPKLWMARP